MSKKRYEAKLEFGDSFIFMRQDANDERYDGIDIREDGKLSGDELTAVTLINDIMRRLRRGLTLAYNYDPLGLMDPLAIVHCQWQSSGNLDIDSKPPLREFMHAVTVEEALSRPCSFTTTFQIAMLLPRRRERRIQMPTSSVDITAD